MLQDPVRPNDTDLEGALHQEVEAVAMVVDVDVVVPLMPVWLIMLSLKLTLPVSLQK